MNKRILVIENDPGIQEILTIIFEQEGFQVMDVKHTENIFSQISSFNPHLILLDIIHPGDEEDRICKLLKSTLKTKHIPIVLMSTMQTLINQLEWSGANDAILKPFVVDVLLQTIKKQLTMFLVDNATI
ncbi:MAG: response regulator receiver [Sphingobacteriales bacterium]|nr:response regulator receiver [Sphingobacteriales bacterium]